MRADVHMHSTFSSDSKSCPEEMILGSIEKGLEMILRSISRFFCLSGKNIRNRLR